MKKVIAVLVLILSFTSVSYSQEINELDFLTSGKWFVESVQIGEEIQEFYQNNSWMIFHADGKYQVVMGNNKKNGLWKFDEEHKVIKLEEEESTVTGLKIEILNETKLLFSATDGDMAYSMKLKK
ncbi:hypothetical protein [uncultured Tenacibaculum sp.]|uniref:hypothetical protein n=1 Tax=uncultured Tenacibaculum sp. TaxID=174713 RepID=UPI00260C63A7|nr:hypothetical protein [uncultured Tenacibaculum sp.]